MRLYRFADLQRARGRIRLLLWRRKHRCTELREGYWTRAAVAAEFECSPQALIYWERKGELEPVKMAVCVAYDETEVRKAAGLLSKAEVAEEEQEETELYEALMTHKPGDHEGYGDEDFEGLSIIDPDKIAEHPRE